jgi:hypothetical protein
MVNQKNWCSIIIGCVKLTVQLRLLPNAAQEAAPRATLDLANQAANLVSEVAWKRRVFRSFDLHHITYGEIRALGLSAQAAVRVIKKVADAYKLDRRTQRPFAGMLLSPTTTAACPGSSTSRP